MKKTSELIKTKDAEEAAFYWTQEDHFELDHVEITEHFNRNITWFVFGTDLSHDDLDQLKHDYLNGKCLVEPRKYSYRRSEIKSIIRENLNPNRASTQVIKG